MMKHVLRLIKWKAKRLRFNMLEDKSYLQAYARDTDARVQDSYKEGIGGFWEEIGQLQFDFLVRQGLQASHTLLDIGCGTLRGGRLFIDFLHTGNYSGFDISEKAIEAARKVLEQEKLIGKRPHLVVRLSGSMKLSDLTHRYDFILAHSVFTHLRESHIEECFSHICHVMHEESQFYFTFNADNNPMQHSYKDFFYPTEFFDRLAKINGFRFALCEYDHPRGQRMGMIGRS